MLENKNIKSASKAPFRGFGGLDNLIRENIKNLKPYSSARHEFTGKASVFLDANENAFGSPLPSAFGVPDSRIIRNARCRSRHDRPVWPPRLILARVGH